MKEVRGLGRASTLEGDWVGCGCIACSPPVVVVVAPRSRGGTCTVLAFINACLNIQARSFQLTSWLASLSLSISLRGSYLSR